MAVNLKSVTNGCAYRKEAYELTLSQFVRLYAGLYP